MAEAAMFSEITDCIAVVNYYIKVWQRSECGAKQQGFTTVTPRHDHAGDACPEHDLCQ